MNALKQPRWGREALTYAFRLIDGGKTIAHAMAATAAKFNLEPVSTQYISYCYRKQRLADAATAADLE